MKEVTFEGNRLGSAVRMGWPVHRCRYFLPAQGLALGMVHLDVLPARPGQAKCPGRWALEPVLLAQWPDVRCTRKSRCLLVRLAIPIRIAWSLISFCIARGSADWPSRWLRGKSPTLQGDWDKPISARARNLTHRLGKSMANQG